MAKVNVTVAGRSYILACKEGGEAQLEALTADIAAKADKLLDQLGPMNEGQVLLMSALLLADELQGAKSAPPQQLSQPVPQPDQTISPELTETLTALTERAEALVRRLETTTAL